MNTFAKILVTVPLMAVLGSATTITFNGKGTYASYFKFETMSGDDYCITECRPDLNPNTETIVTLIIPGSVDGKQVSLGAGAFDWSSYTDFSNLKVELIFKAVGDVKVKMPQICSCMFQEGELETSLAKISIDLTGIESGNITNMQCMFWGCKKLNTIDISFFDTSNTTNMMSLFSHCSNLKKVNVSGLNTSQVTTMRAMFYGCFELEAVDVSSFDTSNVTTMKHMFIDCSSLKNLDLNNFNTSKLADTEAMFKRCTELEDLKISEQFTLSETGINVNEMFNSCSANLRITGSNACKFAPANADVKNSIDTSANTAYIASGSSGVSDSLQTTAMTQLSQPRFEEEIDATNLFGATSSDAVYIGMNTSDKTIVADGSSQIIAGALVNKTIDDIGYYPAALRLTGSISLSGNNSEFNEQSFIVGDGIKDTTITLDNPNALPQTDTIVESKGTLVLAGTENYTLSKNITVKSGGKLNATKRVIFPSGTILRFGA